MIGHKANKEPSILQADFYLMYIYIKMGQGSHNMQEEDNDLYKAKTSYPFVDGIG